MMQQLRPEEVVKPRQDLKQYHKRNMSKNRSTTHIDATQQSTATVSKYSLGNTNNNTMMRLTSNNPYTDVNISQIEYTQDKRDYSPIITTSKHELKKLYDPHGRSGHRNKQSCTSMTQMNKKSRSHSAENYKVGQKRMSAPPTKNDLQKQLYIKQKQLTMMKNQLKKSQKKSQERSKKHVRQPSRTATQTAQVSSMSMNNQNIS